jgi:hypothetical protein
VDALGLEAEGPPAPTASVSRCASRSWGTMACSSSKAVSPWASMPRSLGTCLIEISRASPNTKPSRTDSEKNCATRPSFRAPAAIETMPARMARAAVSAMNSGLPSTASCETVAADMIAIAEDTATTSWRELPRAA